MDYFETIKNGKGFKGKNHLLEHLEGGRLTPLQAMHAKCYECMGNYNDGAVDCESPECPLYPFMPYQKNVIRKSNRIISEETREKMKKSLEKVRLRKREGKKK